MTETLLFAAFPEKPKDEIRTDIQETISRSLAGESLIPGGRMTLENRRELLGELARLRVQLDEEAA